MADWRGLAGVIEWRLDYPAATNQPPELIGVVLSRCAFLVVKPVRPSVNNQRSYRWRIARMSLLEEEPPHQLVPGRTDLKLEPTDVSSWLWPSSGRYPEDAQWVVLNEHGVKVGNPRTSSQGEDIRDMVDPVWYEPVWGAHASGETVSIDAFSRKLLEEHVAFNAIGPFFCSPKVERVRVIHNSELGIVEDVTSFTGDEEVAWLRLLSVHQLA
ncbi:MAG: hypothetical protein FWC87_04605 [Acidimicrobiaceae bacterium]|nr:hypothetical protein [Acidimicrobiaceae bacterium]